MCTGLLTKIYHSHRGLVKEWSLEKAISCVTCAPRNSTTFSREVIFIRQQVMQIFYPVISSRSAALYLSCLPYICFLSCLLPRVIISLTLLPSNIFLFFSVSASFMRNVYPSSVSCKVFSLDVFQVFLHPLRYIFHCFAYYFAKLASSLSFLFLITYQVITNFWRRDSC